MYPMSSQLLGLAIPFIVVSAITTILVSYVSTNDLPKSLTIGVLYFFTFSVATLLILVFRNIQERIIKEIGDITWQILTRFMPFYKRGYRRYIYYLYRFFDLKGLTTRGLFNLELETMYVELTLRDVSNNKSDKSIWEFLSERNDRSDGKRFVIIGIPGSGKTTLLKQMALTLAKNRAIKNSELRRKIPVIIFLRKQAKLIREKPNLTLGDIVDLSLHKEVKPPKGWFSQRLLKGQCVVLLDGLDEIADMRGRQIIVDWVEQQMAVYHLNDYVITSRPHGYEEMPLSGVSVLEILPFTKKQVETFIKNWYLANEIKSSQRDDQGIRLIATDRAEDLIWRLGLNPALIALSDNPLLLTMIATIHSSKDVLPGKRVELYREIFEVFLERRRHWKNDNTNMDQKLLILQFLGYQMMKKNIQVISSEQASKIIKEVLDSMTKKVWPDVDEIQPMDFLKMICTRTGLLIEVENSQYAFAHLTFQEYLASLYIKQNNEEAFLLGVITKQSWAETIRLYAAQKDATNILLACLRQNPLTVYSLSLAMDCFSEALTLQDDAKNELQKILHNGIDNSKLLGLIAKATLSSRLRWMLSLRENRTRDEESYIDTSLITGVEYQLFLEDMSKKGRYFHPDHWAGIKLHQKKGLMPVVGVRPSDVDAFCRWLTDDDLWQASYRIPNENEASNHNLAIAEEADYDNMAITYWVTGVDGKITLYNDNKNMPSARVLQCNDLAMYINSHITILNNLVEARKERDKPTKGTPELLNKNPIVPSYVGSSIKRILPIPDHQMEDESLQKFRQITLLKNYEKYSTYFGIEIKSILDYEEKIVLTNIGESDKLAQWLFEQKQYYMKEFSIAKWYDDMLIFLEANENQLSVANPKIFKNLCLSIKSLFMREWAHYGYPTVEEKVEPEVDDENSRQERKMVEEKLQQESIEIYKFLRWSGIVNLMLALHLTRSAKRSINSEIYSQLIDKAKKVVLGLFVLHQRIDGKFDVGEGIRLIKTVKSKITIDDDFDEDDS